MKDPNRQRMMQLVKLGAIDLSAAGRNYLAIFLYLEKLRDLDAGVMSLTATRLYARSKRRDPTLSRIFLIHGDDRAWLPTNKCEILRQETLRMIRGDISPLALQEILIDSGLEELARL